ncbi:unnamed protein product [Brachionus calyciflorus]|uniref:BHLH domain-containing protein n=1 Tax=Brachionus calyciflorus TaxID=104777 RepID=A0A813MPM6_9BILA|nr:unnamed protein product [Brachionus calyciflorus]
MLHHDQSKLIQNEFLYPHTDTRYIDENMMEELIIPGSEHLNELHLDPNKQIMCSGTNFLTEEYFSSFSSYPQNNNQNYSFHTLQPSSQSYQYTNQGSYMTPVIQTNSNYTPKLITRTPSFNSSVGSSSPSSSVSSASSTNVINSNNVLDFETGVNVKPNDPNELIKKKNLNGHKLSNEELQMLLKDRQRKDNHNMIERRRRFNINDRIKELGQLLPKSGEYDTKQNKGSILKASVDYIQTITLEINDLRKRDEANKYMIQLNKKLCNRIKDLEMLCRSNGIDINQHLNINYNNQLIDPNLNQINSGMHDPINELNMGFTNFENIDTNNSTQVLDIPAIQMENNFYQSQQQTVVNQVRAPAKRAKNTVKKSDAKKDKKDVKLPKLEPISPNSVETKPIDDSKEISSPSISSTSSLVKLMTPNSKDPILTSVSSPSSSPTPDQQTVNNSHDTFYSNKSPNESNNTIQQISVLPCMTNSTNDCY